LKSSCQACKKVCNKFFRKATGIHAEEHER
jgi:hypothetical protein